MIKKDFYEAINGDTLSKLVIPDDRSTMGGFQDLVIGIEKLLISDFDKMEKGELEIPNAEMGEFIKLYKLFKNKNKNCDYQIIKDKITKINDLKNYNDFNNNLYDFIVGSTPLPFNVFVMEDMKNAEFNALYLDVPSIILPDKDYYFDDNSRERLLSIYKEMVKNVFEHIGLENSEKLIDDTIKFDSLLYPNMKNSREKADYVSLYNKRTFDEVISYSENLDFKILNKVVDGELTEVIVSEPKFFEYFKEVIIEDNFELLKSWMIVKTVLSTTAYFDEDLREKGSLYHMTLNGTKKMKEFDKFVYYASTESFSQVVGIYYGEKYFGNEAKKDVEDMVKNLIEVYKKRLNDNKWLSKETIEKAIVKLNHMKMLIAFPDKFPKVYSDIRIDENKSILENLDNVSILFNKDNFSKWGKLVDKTKWQMPANMVNAYFDPTKNLICFPAAILQAPFYSLNQSKSSNYGGIGAVIGHEISHAFDNNGAQYDHLGNIENWWKEEDYTEFKRYQKMVIDQFDGIPFGSSSVKGELTVSENIADNGGLNCSLEALKMTNDYNVREFFENYARIWCQKARPEYIDLLLNVDVHAPAKLRVNVQVKNLDDFYKTFDINEKDEMYLKKEDRIVIW